MDRFGKFVAEITRGGETIIDEGVEVRPGRSDPCEWKAGHIHQTIETDESKEQKSNGECRLKEQTTNRSYLTCANPKSDNSAWKES